MCACYVQSVSKQCVILQAQKQVAQDLLKQLEDETSQVAKMSSRLVETDVSKGVLEEQLMQRESELKALHSQMAEYSATTEDTVKVSVICCIASAHPVVNLPVLSQYLNERVLGISCSASAWATHWPIAIS